MLSLEIKIKLFTYLWLRDLRTCNYDWRLASRPHDGGNDDGGDQDNDGVASQGHVTKDASPYLLVGADVCPSSSNHREFLDVLQR